MGQVNGLNRMSFLYYYYYLFYKKILKDSHPHLLAILALSASEGFATIGVLDIILVKLFCFQMERLTMFSFFLFYPVLNYFIFFKTGKIYRIVELKPKFSNNHILSIIIALLFFLVTLSFIFWVPIYTDELIKKCN
jgi:hypothetical protein